MTGLAVLALPPAALAAYAGLAGGRLATPPRPDPVRPETKLITEADDTLCDPSSARHPDPASARIRGAGESVPTVMRDVPSPGSVPDAIAWIPPGRFSMGSDYAPFGDARPIHVVVLDGFWMDRTPVTNDRFVRETDT